MSSEAPAERMVTPMPEPTGVIGHVVGLIRSKGLRYSMVAAVNVIVGQGLLFALQHWWQPNVANVISVAVSSVPAYYMNRSWVWGKSGKSHMRKEVVPFWAFTIAGLVASTIAITFVQDHTSSKLLILFTQLFVFGVLWVVRFFVLDRLFHVEVFEDDTPDVD
ncbi:MAG: GtrA family protein [Acidobacteria bacterium]|nr:GtrA family protein [Acidobacteriota bacterium]